ncbi:hypothetical protein [Desulfitobacterium sp. AusDCA]|uniref:hypothetical protein n=1 Tax=Desulfitobacterium sp. AusDCA TaxID=3240383 RepID=UPI003DA79B67
MSIALVIPPFKLSGNSDAAWRKRIGNMVPPDAAEVMAEQAFFVLLASAEKVWTMDAEEIWVASKDKGANTNEQYQIS